VEFLSETDRLTVLQEGLVTVLLLLCIIIIIIIMLQEDIATVIHVSTAARAWTSTNLSSATAACVPLTTLDQTVDNVCMLTRLVLIHSFISVLFSAQFAPAHVCRLLYLVTARYRIGPLSQMAAIHNHNHKWVLYCPVIRKKIGTPCIT